MIMYRPSGSPGRRLPPLWARQRPRPDPRSADPDELLLAGSQLASAERLARWRLVRDAVFLTGAAVVVYLGLQLSGVAIPFLLILAVLVGLSLLRRSLRRIAPPEPPATLLRGDALRAGGGPIGEDGLLRATSRWEMRLSWSQSNPEQGQEQFARVVWPRLVAIVDERLWLRHGVRRSAEPGRARELLGDPLWTFMNAAPPSAPSARQLDSLIDAMEEI